MPEIAPFRAVRFAAAEPAGLERLLAPPYDVISPEQREVLAARDRHNIVHLILPKELPGDGEQDNKYRRAGLAYRQWLSESALVRDAQPAIYVLHQQFEWEGQRHLRRGFLARLELHPFSDGIVLPHEKTLAGPKADRLQLFRSVKANLSPIFALYPDESDEVPALLRAAVDRPADATARTDDGVENALWAVTDPALCARIAEVLGPKKAYIADGHHRYETGLAYAKEVDQSLGEPRPEGAHHFILAYLCGMADAGLLILPTHRVLHGLPGFDATDLLRRAGELFTFSPVSASSLATPAALSAARQKLTEAGARGPSFLFAARGQAGLLTLRPGLDLAGARELPEQPELRELDVTVLHALLFQKLLGLSPQSQERQENLRYVKDAAEAIAAVEKGEAQAAFLLNATRMEQVRTIAESGGVLPQKSTFFHPKLPSGLLINPLDADERVSLAG